MPSCRTDERRAALVVGGVLVYFSFHPQVGSPEAPPGNGVWQPVLSVTLGMVQLTLVTTEWVTVLWLGEKLRITSEKLTCVLWTCPNGFFWWWITGSFPASPWGYSVLGLWITPDSYSATRPCMSSPVCDCSKNQVVSEELLVDKVHWKRIIFSCGCFMVIWDSFSNGCSASQMGLRFIQPSVSFPFLSAS